MNALCLRSLVSLFLLPLAVLAADKPASPTALAALKAIPADAQKKVARIEGHDGASLPEQWHVITYDAAEERGIREFIVVGNEIVTDHNASQFVQSAAESEVFDPTSVKIDSGEALARARKYAKTNDVAVAKFD